MYVYMYRRIYISRLSSPVLLSLSKFVFPDLFVPTRLKAPSFILQALSAPLIFQALGTIGGAGAVHSRIRKVCCLLGPFFEAPECAKH